LARYPRDLERDRALASNRGVDVLFSPDAGEMYRGDGGTPVVAGEAAARWGGVIRPGHFGRGLTVVATLFHTVEPTVTVLRQQDTEQVTLVRGMIRDLDFPMELVVGPTVREVDGLAMSSRNVYLSLAERRDALALSRALAAARAEWSRGESDSG